MSSGTASRMIVVTTTRVITRRPAAYRAELYRRRETHREFQEGAELRGGHCSSTVQYCSDPL
jgi:hypothetical protein